MPYSEYFGEDLSPIEFVNRINASVRIERRKMAEQFYAKAVRFETPQQDFVPDTDEEDLTEDLTEEQDESVPEIEVPTFSSMAAADDAAFTISRSDEQSDGEEMEDSEESDGEETDGTDCL